MVRSLIAPVYVLLLAFLSGCASSPKQENSTLLANLPRSILVMPPVNNSVEVNAPYTFLSTISKPLAEKGYYVFPVAVIDQFLKENGLPTPDEMNMIPLDKIRHHIGADAVLYVTISDWGQKFQVISSSTVVSAKLRLVDTDTGMQLWDTTVYGKQNADSNAGGGLLGAVVGAMVDQVAGTLSDNTPQVARHANYNAIYNQGRGLPDGPYRIAKKSAEDSGL